MVQQPQAHNHGKYDNNRNVWYFRFHNEMRYGYILSIL